LLIGLFYFAAPVFKRTPPQLAHLVPIIGLASGLLVFSTFSLESDASELVFRMSLTFETLLNSPLYNVVIGGTDLTFAADSGIVTLVSRAGLLGLLVFFYAGSGIASSERREPTVLIPVMIYLFATATFGAAFLSIKSAAMLGLLIGAAGTGAFAPGFSAQRRR
jgi:hypothetical protein